MKKTMLLVLALFLTVGASGAFGMSYNEVPMFEDLVAQGALPPIEERLPDEPLVVGPGLMILEEHLDFQIGQYGGTLRLANPPGFNPLVFLGNRQPILWAKGAFYFDQGIVGNVVRDWEVSEDYKTYTFHMREGLRWSDGEYVTTEDVRFAVEDILLNPEITPVFPRKYRAGARSTGTIMELSIIDDYTFALSFDEPYGSFPAQIAKENWVAYTDILAPSHFLKQFHIDYTSVEELRPHLDQQELDDDQWWQLFNTMNITHWDMTRSPNDIGFPMLYPWIMVSHEGGSIVYERNPYFFKVDQAGNQLPYIDRIRSEEVADFDMVTMRALTGELDYLGERASLRDMPLLLENAERGDYHVKYAKMHRTPYTISLNLNYPDPVWRELVNDLRVRRALNMAIDREEVIETFYFGHASLPQYSDARFDIWEAERLLDEAGLDQRNAEGVRLMPDGRPFSIRFEVHAPDSDMVPLTELIVEYWQVIGVDASMRQIDPALRNVRQNANELQATTHWVAENMWRRGGTWQDYLPMMTWAPLWTTWYNTGGAEGEEPPPEVMRLYDLHSDFVQALVGSEESNAILDEIYAVHGENLFMMNVVELSHYPTTLNTRLRNVPGPGRWGELGIILNIAFEQWFFEQ